MYEARIAALEAELSRERMRLAACGVVALADTSESAAKAREMHADYRSASCDDVARRVDECISLRAELAQARAECERLRADAERYLWLYSKYEGADFRYGEDGRSVLTFTWPHAVMASLDAAIDAARKEGK
jgi:hypothetical protein